MSRGGIHGARLPILTHLIEDSKHDRWQDGEDDLMQACIRERMLRAEAWKNNSRCKRLESKTQRVPVQKTSSKTRTRSWDPRTFQRRARFDEANLYSLEHV